MGGTHSKKKNKSKQTTRRSRLPQGVGTPDVNNATLDGNINDVGGLMVDGRLDRFLQNLQQPPEAKLHSRSISHQRYDVRAQRFEERVDQMRWERLRVSAEKRQLSAQMQRESMDEVAVTHLFQVAFKKEAERLRLQRKQQKELMAEQKAFANFRQQSAQNFFMDQMSILKEAAAEEEKSFTLQGKAQAEARRTARRELKAEQNHQFAAMHNHMMQLREQFRMKTQSLDPGAMQVQLLALLKGGGKTTNAPHRAWNSPSKSESAKKQRHAKETRRRRQLKAAYL